MALGSIYQFPFGLFTDLYQLTMAYGYWKQGLADRESVFHLFFRKNPFSGGYVLSAGLATAVELIQAFRFDASDIEFLASITGNDDQPLFEDAFLRYLETMSLQLSVDAIPEGTVVFPHEPMIRVKGPLLQAQLVESALLNVINFQTLIATKSARVCRAAGDQSVLEFGLRRAQGVDGSLSATRAAFIGGVAATSNVLAGKIWGIPVKGTHAHSWVMTFEDEITSFAKYAEVMPNNCVFLVDTYDTLEGVRNAIEVGRRLRQQGHEMVGIRLDSGDLAYLSIEARKLLDDAGFPDAQIIASNDLDEHLIENLRQQDAQITVWGVGTKMATAYDQPALGGVYKLGAIRDEQGEWQPKVKLSEQLIKVSNPGVLQVRRFYQDGLAQADMIFDECLAPNSEFVIVDPLDATRRRTQGVDDSFEDLLVPVLRQGERVYAAPSLPEIQQRARTQLTQYHPTILRLQNPHGYPVGLEQGLYQRKLQLIEYIRHGKAEE